ncbi:MAG: LysM peptidoglycan-binding domain-containing protein [Verrucomicrobiales bacterium]
MKPKLFVQRRKKAPQRGFRVLNAVTSRKKKQRAATASNAVDELDEVPNFGVASALVVILVLHVVAILAIFLHGKLTGGENYVAATSPEKTEVSSEELPPPDDKYEHYLFQAGDTYEAVARKESVDIEDLKAVNNHLTPKPGDVINLPILKGERVEDTVEPQVAAIPDSTEAEPPIRPTSRPVIEDRSGELFEPGEAPEMVEVTPSGGAVLIKPRVEEPAVSEDMAEPAVINSPEERTPARAVVVEEPEPAPAAQQTYTIRSGDTIWRISKKYGVSQQALMRLNGISDPGRIQIGQTLKIPN